MINRLKSISKIQILAIILIVVGLAAMLIFGRRFRDSYRDIEYARQNNFEAGNPDPDLIRPWMTLRYVAVAYTVPIEYLLARLELPLERNITESSLDDLNEDFEFGREVRNGRPEPIIIDQLAEAILEYRANPVPTGLRANGVRPWMSVQYIANTTGIPADFIFTEINLPMEGNAFLPLDKLADENKYEGGLRALLGTIQQIVDNHQGSP